VNRAGLAAEVPTKRDDWLAEAKRLFGPDARDWKFKCPACGHVQTARDFKAANADPNQVYFNCLGRYLPNPRSAFGHNRKDAPKQPCDYTSGGLLRIGRQVEMDGKVHNVFPFASPDSRETSKAAS
jgi:predicted RNA-binding Zn-ribbon protein involved in translation (DUF1610 family)